MEILDITPELEAKSKWGVHEYDRTPYWAAINGTEDKIIRLRAVSEMEAIDRLREFCTDFGRINWISQKKYNDLVCQQQQK